MKVGITLPNLGTQATRDNLLQTATQAEKEGFDSVWTITRILWPLKPQTPYGLTPDGSLPTEYQTVLDPLLDVLTNVAANTNKISLGIGIIDIFSPRVIAGPLEYIENSIKSIRGQASQVNKNPDKFQIIISAAPNFKSSSRDENRFPFSGTIDEI